MHPKLSLLAIIVCIVLLSPADIRAADSLSCNMNLLSNVDTRPNGYIDCWGFASGGDEYAILAYKSGTIFYRVTDPVNPVEVGFMPGIATNWRDIKTHGDYAYIVTDFFGGNMQIVDISNPESVFLANTWTGIFTAHNAFLDSATSRLYVLGSDLGSGGLRILDIGTDPLNPVEIGSWETRYIHDIYVENDTAYAACYNAQEFWILDVSDPANIVDLASVNYGHGCHSTWLIEDDHNYLLTTDEENRGRIRCWDISDVTNITQVSRYRNPGQWFTVHNVFVVGSMAYISYYQEGIRMVDFTDPLNPVEVGFYDTRPVEDATLFTGAFGVYPYLPSGNIIASDMVTGLYMLEMDPVVTGVGETAGFLPRLATETTCRSSARAAA